MKKIFISICIFVFISTACLAGQSSVLGKKGSVSGRVFCKAFLIKDVKGSLEEIPIADLAPEIGAAKIITREKQVQIDSLLTSQAPVVFYARPPPE